MPHRRRPDSVRRYAAIKLDKLPPPPPGPAIRGQGVRFALWCRAKRSLRWLVGTAGSVVAWIAIEVIGAASDLATGLLVVLALVAVGTLGVAATGLIQTAMMWEVLAAGEWTVYRGENLFIPERGQISLTLRGKGNVFHLIWIRNGRRAETLRGMVRPEMWFVGDPLGRGIVTVAGGGEMFFTHPTPSALAYVAGPQSPVQTPALPSLLPAVPRPTSKLSRLRGAQKIKWQ